MWKYVELPEEIGGPEQRETLIRQFAEEKMREYDGAVFFCISRADKERRLTFRQAAASLGYSARDGRATATAWRAQTLAERAGKNVLFVDPAMQSYLEEYLDICPAGSRHVLIYCHRKGNGPSPRMSAFMDFWEEHGVDIWDLGEQ
jgi:hypothetical protein